MPDNLEIIRLNKDEEFEYFVTYKRKFHKWTLEEHSLFSKATLEYDILKPDQLNEILKVINQHNTNVNSRHRTIDELNIHIKVYQNYLNKQSILRNPLSFNPSESLTSASSTSTTSTTSTTSSGLSTGVSTSGITNNSLSLLNNIHSVNSSNNDILLNNMITNNYISIINSLDNIPTSTNSIKDISANNPLLPKNQTFKLASKPIPSPPQLSPTLKSSMNNSNGEVEINNSNFSQELNKKDLKILQEPWTAEDQKKFEIALEKYPITRFSSVSRWQMVGKEVGITPKAAALRYNQMLSQLMPKKPSQVPSSINNNTNTPITPTTTTTTTTSTTPEKDSSLGKRTRRTSASKESPLKKEKLAHETNTPISDTTTEPTINQDQNSNQVDELLLKNDLLLEQMKSNIMNNEIPSISSLTEIIDNLNGSIKITDKWKPSNSMPPLPLKVNDMILKMLQPKSTATAIGNPFTNSNNPFNILTQKKITPTTNLSKRGLTKNAEEWNLVYDDE